MPPPCWNCAGLNWTCPALFSSFKYKLFSALKMAPPPRHSPDLPGSKPFHWSYNRRENQRLVRFGLIKPWMLFLPFRILPKTWNDRITNRQQQQQQQLHNTAGKKTSSSLSTLIKLATSFWQMRLRFYQKKFLKSCKFASQRNLSAYFALQRPFECVIGEPLYSEHL